MTIAAIACAIIVAAALGIALSHRLAQGSVSHSPADRPAMNLAAIVPLSAPEHPAGSTAPAANPATANAPAAVPAPVPSRPTLTVRYPPIGPHTHFVELTVACSVPRLCRSLNWWTEDATARHDVDYMQQSSAGLQLPNGRGTARLYVKLNSGQHRAGREYFFVAIASPGIPGVTRVPVWLSPVAKGGEDRADVARR